MSEAELLEQHVIKEQNLEHRATYAENGLDDLYAWAIRLVASAEANGVDLPDGIRPRIERGPAAKVVYWDKA